jgi:hypothetical protein
LLPAALYDALGVQDIYLRREVTFAVLGAMGIPLRIAATDFGPVWTTSSKSSRPRFVV